MEEKYQLEIRTDNIDAIESLMSWAAHQQKIDKGTNISIKPKNPETTNVLNNLVGE